MRTLHKYTSCNLTYVNTDGEEYPFQADEITSNRKVNLLLGMPIKDGGSRFITDYEIPFKIDGRIIQGEEDMRITAIPEIKPIGSNNTRRGVYLKERVIETS